MFFCPHSSISLNDPPSTFVPTPDGSAGGREAGTAKKTAKKDASAAACLQLQPYTPKTSFGMRESGVWCGKE